MRGRRRKSERGGRLWLIIGIGVLVILVSGGLIAYNILSRETCGYLGVGGVEVYFDSSSKLLPNMSLVAVGPRVARYEVYVFYDLYCPYCAWELYESLGILLSYARDGKIKLYFVDTILHPEALEPHGLLRATVGFDSIFLEALYKASCQLHVNRVLPDASFMRRVLSEFNVSTDDKRVRDEAGVAQRISGEAVQLLATITGNPAYVGTPTIVVYDVEFGRIVNLVPGRVEPGKLDSLLRSLP